MPKSKRAAIYVRISRDRTGQEAGVDRQEHECRDLVDARGWSVADVYRDNDLSAYSGKPRPGFDALLAAVAAGSVDVVVAWHPDRLTRRPRELEDLIDVLELARCPVETVRAGAVDLTTRSGRTTARLVGAVARDESEAKAERLQAMHRDKARRGEWSGGLRPYGYRPARGALVIDTTEAAVITEAAERVLAGESLHAICADLNKRRTPTARGGQWRTPTLRRILTSPTVAGRREHQGEDVGPAKWHPILPEATWRRVGAALAARNYRRGRVARVSLLAGIARCGACGAALATQRRAKRKGRADGVRVYVCPARSLGGCGGVSIVADQLDVSVAEAVCAAIDEGALRKVSPSSGRPDPAIELSGLDRDLAELARDFGEGRIDRAEWLAARGPLEKRRDVARAHLASDATAVIATAKFGHLADSWGDLSLDQQRAIVGAVVGAVTVHRATKRGPGFDPSRLAVDWRA